MATSTLSTQSSILKTRFLGTVQKTLDSSSVLVDRIAKKIAQNVSGNTFVFALNTGRNASALSGRADYGTLPTADRQKYSNSTAAIKFSYGRFEVSGPTMAATKDNLGAYVDILSSEVDGLTRDTKRAFNRQLHGDGRDALAFWTTADNTTAATVDDSFGNSHVKYTGTFTGDLIDTDNTTKNGDSIEFTISKTTSGTYEASWSAGSVSSSGDGDYLVMEDTLGNQLMGIEGIIDSGNPALGNLQSIDATAAGNEWWRAQVVGSMSSATSLSFEDMQEVIDLIETESDSNANELEFILMGHGVRRAYYQLCITERRSVNRAELDGGWKGLEFNGLVMIADPLCRRQTMYFVNPKSLALLRTQDFDWMDRDGSYLNRVSNKDAYEAVLYTYQNLVSLSRNSNGKLQGIIEA